MARAYLDAIARLRGRTDADAIARAIADGRPYVPAADLPLFEQAMAPAVELIHDAVQQAGQLTAGRIKDGLGVGMRFDITNPLAVQAARETAAAMVTNVSAETRLAIRNVVTRAIEDGITYTDAAKMIRALVGLTARDSMAVLNLRASLIELGLNRDKVRAKVASYAAKKLRERALTIARSEIMAAANDGQLAAWRQAQARGLLPPDAQRLWLITSDGTTCDDCLDMAGMKVPLHAAFPGGDPPRHPRCRCTAVLVVKKAA